MAWNCSSLKFSTVDVENTYILRTYKIITRKIKIN